MAHSRQSSGKKMNKEKQDHVNNSGYRHKSQHSRIAAKDKPFKCKPHCCKISFKKQHCQYSLHFLDTPSGKNSNAELKNVKYLISDGKQQAGTKIILSIK